MPLEAPALKPAVMRSAPPCRHRAAFAGRPDRAKVAERSCAAEYRSGAAQVCTRATRTLTGWASRGPSTNPPFGQTGENSPGRDKLCLGGGPYAHGACHCCSQGRDAQRPKFAVGLRYEHSSDRVRSISLLPERKRQFAAPPLHPIRFDVRDLVSIAFGLIAVGRAWYEFRPLTDKERARLRQEGN